MLSPHARTANAFTRAGKPLVARVPHYNGDYLPDTIAEVVALLGGVGKVICAGDRVVIKPNFNCSFATPLSTDRAFLAAVIELLLDAGARVSVGELAGKAAWPTARVVEDLQILPLLAHYGVEFVDFEHDRWLPLAADGRYWQSFRVPCTLYAADHRVYLANMRCHNSARFTASLKLGVGWIDLKDREFLHERRDLVEAKIADLHLGWQPDLVLIDGRRSTVAASGRGEYVYPNVVLASGDMVAIDAEAVRILKEFPGQNGLGVPLAEMAQLQCAQAYGLGTLDYDLVQAPAHTHTIQPDLSEAEARF